MNLNRPLLIILLAAMLVFSTGALSAREYVSLNGGFVITYPEGWFQVDYVTVDYYLYNQQATPESFDYDAVFAEEGNAPFHNGNYFILTVDTVGELSRQQIDSVLNDLKEELGNKEKTVLTGDILTDLKSGEPYYDREAQTITLLSEVSDEEVIKKNVWVMKFYDGGIANFYFFSPDSVFADSKVLFNKIVQSFSTENIEASLPREDLKLSKSRDEDRGNSTIWYVGGALLLVLAVVIIVIFVRK